MESILFNIVIIKALIVILFTYFYFSMLEIMLLTDIKPFVKCSFYYFYFLNYTSLFYEIAFVFLIESFAYLIVFAIKNLYCKNEFNIAW